MRIGDAMEDKFFNRELSWIEFNARVLNKALDKNVPLLERVQFLSIVSSNFDEFFQVRVAGVKREGNEALLKQIAERSHQVIKAQHECLMEDVVPSLTSNGLVYVPPAQYTSEQEEAAKDVFRMQIEPLLTPLRLPREEEGEMPFIKGLTLYAAFLLKPIEGIKPLAVDGEMDGDGKTERIALVPFPAGLQKIVWLPQNEAGKTKQFALLDDIIGMFGTQLFPGFEVVELLFFRIARDADFAVDEDAGDNFVHAMEDVLEARKSSAPVFLACSVQGRTAAGGGMILPTLMERLDLCADDVYPVDGILEPSSLLELRPVASQKMVYPEWQHYWPATLPKDEPFWDTLSHHDVLLNVPYMSYDPVVKFITDAAEDKDVLAIKMTLYRTGSASPIVSALEKAASNGKQVVALVELKARFDEERNIAWATELEKSGVIVVYGLVNLKVHAKALMIMRREGEGVRRYVHLSTGNYNHKTAKLYSDLSLFTANEEIATDVTEFFNLVTGYSTLQTMKHLAMAPVAMRTRLVAMIDREAKQCASGGKGLIMAKMNSLTHEDVICALYRASRAGVKVLLNVRGICMLVPGVKGMSENIKVTSIVDRYLEHARIFYFLNGGNDELYLSSADWMPRNLDRRIELMFPLLDSSVFKEAKKVLDTYFEDNMASCALRSDGTWTEHKGKSAQEVFYHRCKRLFGSGKGEKGKTGAADFTVRRK